MSIYEKKPLNAKFQRLGEGATTETYTIPQIGITGAIMALLIVAFLLFVNFHVIYVKTGTPMMKYGMAMTFLQPFYSVWATWVLTSKYVLRR